MRKFLSLLKQFPRRHPAWGICIVLCLVPVLAWFAWSAYTNIKLMSTIRRIERQGIVCRYSGFKARHQASPEALLREFLRLGEAVRAAEEKCMDKKMVFDAKAFVAGNAQLLKEADTFLERNPKLVFKRDFDQGDPFAQQLPELSVARAWARSNAARIRLLAKEGKTAEAARLFDDIGALRSCLLNDPFLISFLVAVAVETIRTDALGDLASTGGIARIDVEQLKRWEQSAVKTEAEFRNALPAAVETESTGFSAAGMHPRLLKDAFFELTPWNLRLLWLYEPVIRLDAAHGLECIVRIHALATRNYTPAVKAELGGITADAISGNAFRHPVTRMLFAAWGSSFIRASEMYGQQRTLRAGLAAERFLREKGRPPKELAELVPEYLPEIPKNPFTGDPLKIESGTLERRLPDRRTETFEGFRIYGGGDPDKPEFGSTRTDREGWSPVWNRVLKK